MGAVELCAPWETPVGTLLVSWGSGGVTGIAPPDLLASRLGGRAPTPVKRLPDDLRDSLDARLRGEPAEVDVDFGGLTPFARDVLAAAGGIPFGEVRPYGWVAQEIGRPAAVRAVGSALGRNPVPVIVPCHRVVHTGGAVGQYAFGLPMKLQLLELEGVRRWR